MSPKYINKQETSSESMSTIVVRNSAGITKILKLQITNSDYHYYISNGNRNK